MKQTIKDALVEYGMAVLKNNEKTAKAILKKHFEVESRTDLTEAQGQKYCELLEHTLHG